MALSFDPITDSKQWYAPAVGNNREDDDPFQVLISCLSAQEHRKIQKAQGNVTKLEANWVARGQAMADKIFADHVHDVRGFNVGAIKPTDGKSLLEAFAQIPSKSAELLYEDIMSAIQDASVLKAGLLDKLGSPSES